MIVVCVCVGGWVFVPYEDCMACGDCMVLLSGTSEAMHMGTCGKWTQVC